MPFVVPLSQEFVLLRLNQTRTWQYIAGLVEVLNRNAAEAGQELDTLEKALTALETRVNALPAMVSFGVSHTYTMSMDCIAYEPGAQHDVCDGCAHRLRLV